MSKRNRERRQGEEGRPAPSGGGSDGPSMPSWLPTILSVVALSFCAFLWMDAKRAADGLKKVEEKVTVLTTQLAAVQASRPAQQRASGPDPAKVYPINIAGAPLKGNPKAPIVIAEFSDYQ
jgi:protein-disulfide isomerase